MTISSLNTNLAALSAQLNISNATSATGTEVSALSSGSRIVHASDDVAALAAGTALSSQVNTLNTSLTVASQGSSLLQVADGGLSQIQSILQRQQAIATQAQSGSLSTTQLGFLNQEFTQLSSQIDQLAGSTNFNGVNLLNGSIAGGANVNTNTATGNANTAAAVTLATVSTLNTANDTLTLSIGGGPTLTFKTTTDANATNGDVAGGSTAAQEAANLAAALNNSGDSQLANFRFTSDSSAHIQAIYTGPATSPSNIPTITVGSSASGGHITLGGTGNNGIITYGPAQLANGANAAGTNGSGLVAVISAADTVGDTITVNGVTLTSVAANPTSSQFVHGGTVNATAASIATALNASGNAAFAGLTFTADSSGGNIYAYYNGSSSPSVTVSVPSGDTSLAATSVATNQTVVTTGSIGLSAGTTSAIGTPTGNLLVSGGTNISSAGNAGQAVNLTNVYGNSAFAGAFGGSGSIGAFQATYDAASTPGASGITLSTVIGGITYTAAEATNTTLGGTSPTTITFNGNNTATGTPAGGSFTITVQSGQSAIGNQTQASQFANALNAGLSNVQAYQNRNVTSFNNAFTTTVGSTQTATLQGASLSFNSNSFGSPLVSSVSISAPGVGQTDATITAVVNGQTYSTIAGIGDTFKTNSQIVLQNTSNPSQQLILSTGSTAATGAASGVAIDLSSSSNASAFQASLSSALGLSNTNAALTFQVGSTSNAVLGVSIGSATSSALFNGQSLDVSTQADAATAETAVGNALNTVTALRANVGALEERFNYASNAIQSAVQNEGAAQSTLLDTDVSSESTKFATSQVQLQAGIAVLAQANQLQQNLVKLIS